MNNENFTIDYKTETISEMIILAGELIDEINKK